MPEILRGASPREILAKLIDGDGLEIGHRCREEMFAMAYLVEPTRLQLRATARIAHAAPDYTGEPPLAQWIRAVVHRSLEELLQEDLHDDLTSIPTSDTSSTHHQFVSQILGIEPLLARHACVSFNALPVEVRRTWWALAVERKTVNRWVAEGNGPPGRVREQLGRAMRALGLPRAGGEDRGGLQGG